MQKLFGQQENSNVQGYDAETVRRVLARASHWESQEQERISAEHIEALGKEIGLSPQAVRRALQEIDPKAQVHPNTLTLRSIFDTCKPGLNWALAVFMVFRLGIHFGMGSSFDPPAWLVVTMVSILFVLPFAIYFFNGRKQKDVRLGMIGGGVGMLATLIAFRLATENGHAVASDSTGLFWLTLIGISIITGGMGSAMSNKIDILPQTVSPRTADR